MTDRPPLTFENFSGHKSATHPQIGPLHV